MLKHYILIARGPAPNTGSLLMLQSSGAGTPIWTWRDVQEFGMVIPYWSMKFPENKWSALITIPVLSYGFAGMPPATPTNIASWLITGTIFNFFVFRYHHKRWWQKYNYVLSAAIDAGTAFMGVLLFFALQNNLRAGVLE